MSILKFRKWLAKKLRIIMGIIAVIFTAGAFSTFGLIGDRSGNGKPEDREILQYVAKIEYKNEHIPDFIKPVYYFLNPAAKGVKITREEFSDQFSQMINYYRNFAPTLVKGINQEEIKNITLNNMIDRIILLHATKLEKVKVTKAELEEKIDEIKKLAKITTDEQFNQYLRMMGHPTFDVFKESLRKDLLIDNLQQKIKTGVKVTEDEIKKEYEKIKKEGTKEEYEKEKVNIRKRLVEEKKQQKYNKWFEEFKKKVIITILDPQIIAFRKKQENKLKEAIEYYQKAARIFEYEPYIHYNLAKAYEEYAESIKTDKEKKEYYNNALKEYKKASELIYDADIYFGLAQFYEMKINDNKLAYKKYKEAQQFAGDDLSLHYSLKAAFERLGKDKDVEYEISKIAEINKKQEELRKRLEEERMRVQTKKEEK